MLILDFACLLVWLLLHRQWTPPMVSTECSSSVRQMLISTEKRGWVLGVLGRFCLFYLAIWHGMCRVALISQWLRHQCQVCPPGECSVSWHWSSRHEGRCQDLAASPWYPDRPTAAAYLDLYLTFGYPLHCRKQSDWHHLGAYAPWRSQGEVFFRGLNNGFLVETSHELALRYNVARQQMTALSCLRWMCIVQKMQKYSNEPGWGRWWRGGRLGKGFVDFSGSKMEGFSYRSRLDHANWDPSGSGDRDKSSRDKSSPKRRHSDSCLLLLLLAKDKSPLENMHCSKMFELVGQARCVLAVQWVVRIMRMLWDRLQKLDPKSSWTVLSCQGNIFSTLSKTQYHDVRKVCVEAILHTDNAQHFSMIKDVQMLYEAPWACRFGTWWNNLQQPHVWRLFTCHHRRFPTAFEIIRLQLDHGRRCLNASSE